MLEEMDQLPQRLVLHMDQQQLEVLLPRLLRLLVIHLLRLLVIQQVNNVDAAIRLLRTDKAADAAELEAASLHIEPNNNLVVVRAWLQE